MKIDVQYIPSSVEPLKYGGVPGASWISGGHLGVNNFQATVQTRTPTTLGGLWWGSLSQKAD
jgi:hypothetical protein